MAERRRVLSLDQSEKEAVKELVALSIRKAFEPSIALPEPPSPALEQHYGVFVTLKLQGELRGCIGDIEADRPIWPTLQEMAQHAAFKDPRFPPLQPGELHELEIEVSILSPLERCTDLQAVEPGRHGLAVQRGMHSGLLLPQVAAEQGWDRETFLEQACRKAGLPPNCWQSRKAAVYVFEAEVF